jgi:Asp-tRNA(Asn)/Glu-tRNA(Gln) amidotransferase C subunit
VTGLKDVTRPDEVVDYQAQPGDLLTNAPATEKDQFKVKRMVN